MSRIVIAGAFLWPKLSRPERLVGQAGPQRTPVELSRKVRKERLREKH